MASSSPDTYKGLLEAAQKLYDKVYNETNSKDNEGFGQLVKCETVDDGVENLPRMIGRLEQAIMGLGKSSNARNKYEQEKDKMETLLKKLRDLQKSRSSR